MVMQIKRYSVLIFFILFVFHWSKAQEVEKALPLIEVLSVLEKQHKIQFNYAEDLISKTYLDSPPKTFTLEEALLYLQENTGFDFNVVNNTTVLVVARQEKINLQELSEVTISGYIVRGINKLDNGSFEIDISDFDILPGLIDTDVLQAAQAFPGIQSINETVSDINIRGGTHDQNLMLWDDIKMYQSGHFFWLNIYVQPSDYRTCVFG